uniref:HAT C-terminal dimerisation domain-containing protein n=1 Tax=Rhipicephalus pulchellus TaxID=72859 RepID=L7M0A4_RHIPC
MSFCSAFYAARLTTFNPSVLEETDSNGDPIKLWCQAGPKSSEAKCVLCNIIISCAQHGTSAVKRHAGAKMHLKSTEKHRNADGKLVRPKTVQATLNFSGEAAASFSLSDNVARAEALFALSLVVKGVPFSYAETAFKTFPAMFPDSRIAEKFTCGRTKATYLISDGLGPCFRQKVLEEVGWPDVYYTIQIDETPKPEQHVQQLDILLRYFSKSQQKVVIEHLESFNLGRATATILVDCIEKSLAELPKERLLCFFSDGPNTMKSVKRKLNEEHGGTILNIGECNLHKVHNAFNTGLNAFGSDVELLVIDVYYFFKHAVRSSNLKAHQKDLGIPEHVFLRHVNNRWLTFLDSLERVLEQYDVLKAFFRSEAVVRPSGAVLRDRLAAALSDKKIKAKMLFLRSTAELFIGFQAIFQRQEPLIHVVYSESVSLVRKLLSRFMRHDAYSSLNGAQLKQLDVGATENLRQMPEIGLDTEEEMQTWSTQEKKGFRMGVQQFYIATAKHLLKQLPLDNKLLKHLRFLDPGLSLGIEQTVQSLKYVAACVPQIIKTEQVVMLVDEWHSLHCRPAIEGLSISSTPIDSYWAAIFTSNSQKYPLLSVLVRALLPLPHGNADCERGFSENKRIVENRASLAIATINGIRQVKSYMKRFGSDPCSVPFTRDIMKAVKSSHNVYSRRLQRESEEQERLKRKTSVQVQPIAEKRMKLCEEKQTIEKRLASSKGMLERAQGLIKAGLAQNNISDIESGQVLLAEANSSLSENMAKLAAVNLKIQEI